MQTPQPALMEDSSLIAGNREFVKFKTQLSHFCRYTVPVGPVCDFYSTVGCHNCEETCAANNCPGETECDTSTDCQCSDCKTDADCSSGEKCCNRQCAISCDGDTTTTTTTTPKPAPTNTACPMECCSDDDCEVKSFFLEFFLYHLLLFCLKM